MRKIVYSTNFNKSYQDMKHTNDLKHSFILRPKTYIKMVQNKFIAYLPQRTENIVYIEKKTFTN